MVSFIIYTPHEMLEHIARQAQAKRLSQNLSQTTLSERSGVSISVLKKFERTGKISFESLLKISLALGTLEEFNTLFKSPSPESRLSLDELMKDKKRKRGRQ